jgi:hypothetical protein
MAFNTQSLCLFVLAVRAFANQVHQPDDQLSHQQPQIFSESFSSFSSVTEDKNGHEHSTSEEVDCIGGNCKETDCTDGNCKEQGKEQSRLNMRGSSQASPETEHLAHPASAGGSSQASSATENLAHQASVGGSSQASFETEHLAHPASAGTELAQTSTDGSSISDMALLGLVAGSVSIAFAALRFRNALTTDEERFYIHLK